MNPSSNKKPYFVTVLLSLSIFFGSIFFNQVYLQKKPSSIIKHSSSHLYANFFAFDFGDKDVAIRYDSRLFIVKDDTDDSSLHDAADENVIYVSSKEGVSSICLYVPPTDATYIGELSGVTASESIKPGEKFTVEVSVKNTGTTAWFSFDSGCMNQTYVNLGTKNDEDRASIFAQGDSAIDGWISDNRVAMVEEVVYPGELATFKFTSIAPAGDAWYKEYFAPVVENVKWLDEAIAEVNIVADSSGVLDTGLMDIVQTSTNSTLLTGEEWIGIDLSDQMMYLHVGDTIIREFQVSSGKSSTPTPTGSYTILNKQELRVGGEWPHYSMPNWMGFTSSGHGIHALPYLANDNGAFWSEALTHIGTPVSHGCVRVLPEDSEITYAFGEVGMRVEIQK
ncbi:MAG: L,D-transpeptidase family protein [Candidatus Gracilibacteria bacterium]|jgi:hypothetical protein